MKQFYNAEDIAEITGCSISKAYCYIREMNSELEKQGFLVVRGKIPATYARKRFSLEVEELCQN